MGCIYLVRNKVNMKGYIGCTNFTLERRRLEHEKSAGNGSKTAFHRALRKYGPDAFEWKVIMKCEDENDLNESEIASIATLGTKTPNGYNMTDGGEGIIGYIFSIEDRWKMSQAQKGNQNAKGIRSVEAKQKMSEARKGKTLSVEIRRKISEAGRGRIRSLESRKRTSNSMKGNQNTKGLIHSAETRRKISKAMGGNQNARRSSTR